MYVCGAEGGRVGGDGREAVVHVEHGFEYSWGTRHGDGGERREWLLLNGTCVEGSGVVNNDGGSQIDDEASPVHLLTVLTCDAACATCATCVATPDAVTGSTGRMGRGLVNA